MSSFVPSSSGLLTIPVLNVNFLYLQGVPVGDISGSIAYLQNEIDALDNQLTAVTAITNRIDLTGLTGNLVITDSNKNSVLLTAIQQLQGQVGSINKLDLSALPTAPPASCIITPATTNQALKSLIDTNTSSISTINGQITTLQNQVASINTSITAINAKLAHISVWTVPNGGGTTTMTGIRDNTGFAVDLSADDSSNGLFVYPNNDAHNAQVRIETAQDKQLYMRGGSACMLYGGANGSITNRNAIFIGDATDNIKIGSFSGAVNYPVIDIGCSGVGLADSTTHIRGDVYLTKHTTVSPVYTQVVTADGDAGFVGRLDVQSALSLDGLAVTTTATHPIIPITNLFGAITLTTGAGLISLITGVGGINLTCGGGAMALSTGGGAMSINCGAGVLNMASGTGNSNWTTANGDVYIGAGKGTGGSAGGVTLQSIGNIVIQPDASLNLYHTDFMEMNSYPVAPATTTRRIYDISGNLYYNGQLLTNGQDPSGVYVLRAGDTMTGTLNVPQVVTPIVSTFVTDLSLNSSLSVIVNPLVEGRYNKTGYVEFNDNATAPPVTANRLYQQGNQLYFDGSAIGGGGAGFLPLSGGTLTGVLNSNFDAGQTTAQLNLINTNNTAPVSGQGATVVLRNDSTGAGSNGERCGQVVFQGRDSVSASSRTYGSIQGFINDPTSTSIDGRLSTFVASANTQTEMMRLVSTSTGVRQINLAGTNTIIGASAIGASTTDTLRVQGSTSITTTLDVPTIQNAVNIYPATSTTQVDNAVRQYQPERLYKLATYPEPLSAPTRDGEKIYFVNPTGVPSSSMDSFVKNTDFPSQGLAPATWLYIQKCCFLKGSSVSGGLDAYYFANKYSDGNSYIFCYLDLEGTTWKMYLVCKVDGEINDMCVGNPVYQGGGLTHRVYYGGNFTNAYTALDLNTPVTVNNVGMVTVSLSATSGITGIGIVQMNSTKDPAVAHEPNFTGITGVAGVVNCIVNVSGSNGFDLATNSDVILIGGLFYNIGATGGVVNYRNLASIAWYNSTWTSGLQTDYIGWSTLANNATNTAVVCGVGDTTTNKNVYGIGMFPSGWGLMVYEGTTFNDQAGTVTNSNYMAYFYKASGTVSFQVLSSDDQFIETGQTFPKENQYNITNIVKGGNPTGGTAQYGDFIFDTLAVTNGLTPAGGSNWGINWRPTSNDPYQTTLALVIDDLTVNPARQPTAQFSAFHITGFFCKQTVYPDEYFLGVFNHSANVYEGYTLDAPFNNPNYSSIDYNGAFAVIRNFAGYNNATGYTGVNCWGQSAGDFTCDWFYKTTSAGDLVVELSGCLVRTAPNIYAKDTITFVSTSDGSSLCLIGDTSTSTNPFGKPSWWAFAQDGVIKYDDTTVDSGGINSIVAGTGISAVTSSGSTTISNTGVTSIVAGTNVTISSTGSGGTGEVTINASATPQSNTTGYLKYGTQPTSTVFLNNTNSTQQSYTPFPAYYFPPTYDRVAYGIATAFDLYNDGSLPSGSGYIRWTGSQPITFTMRIPLQLVCYDANNNRVSLPNTNGYEYSAFAYSTAVFNSVTGMEQNDNPQALDWWGIGCITTLDYTTSQEFFDYEGNIIINGYLQQNDYIRVRFCANSIFNRGTGNHQPVNTFKVIAWESPITITAQYITP